MATGERVSEREREERWERETFARAPEREAPFSTISGEAIKPLYTEADLPAGVGGDNDPIGFPGEFPYTRGVYGSMYRGRLWTMRQFAGFGTAKETNARFRYLLDQGQTGLSTAFDMPSLMGLDSDHPLLRGRGRARGGRGRHARRMDTLFAGIPLDQVTVSMTINAPAAIMLAFYVVAAERRGYWIRRVGRDDPDGHPQGVHRAEGVVLPGRSGDAARRRHDRVVRFGDAAVAPDLDLRLSHPGGGIDGRPGACVHVEGRADVCGAGGGAGARRRRFRAAVVVLLQRAHRFLRGDREVPSGSADLGRELRDKFGAKRPSRGECGSIPRPRACR